MKKYLIYSNKDLIAVLDNHTEAVLFKEYLAKSTANIPTISIEHDRFLYFKRGDFELAAFKFNKIIEKAVDDYFKDSYSYVLLNGKTKLILDTLENIEKYQSRLFELLYRHNFKTPALKIERIEKPLVYDHFRDVLVTKWIANPSTFSISDGDIENNALIDLDDLESGIDFQNKYHFLENIFVEIEDEYEIENVLERTLR